ncbi:MAG TPA: archaellin/type IV pilin N-terminal domain-containing protein, partial [Candidatus Thermoplasmatota archaeon]|nr:archaellin/type IV pilin N-terminal domain-containing protein [Candidatus Thermoplasmatota archaeon]
MKANSKILAKLTNRDDAVSPVIAVILMVAITVVLAATVYVWVSGFSG